MKRLLELLAKLFGKVKPPQPEPSTPLPKIRWLGSNYSGARETLSMNSATITERAHSFSPAAPASWPKKIVKVEVQGIICLFYERGGEIVGGKYDWTRPNQNSKGLENLHHNYNYHTMPQRGAKCWTMLVSVDEKQRSDLKETLWK